MEESRSALEKRCSGEWSAVVVRSYRCASHDRDGARRASNDSPILTHLRTQYSVRAPNLAYAVERWIGTRRGAGCEFCWINVCAYVRACARAFAASEREQHTASSLYLGRRNNYTSASRREGKRNSPSRHESRFSCVCVC
jgi:hypothetical protein